MLANTPTVSKPEASEVPNIPHEELFAPIPAMIRDYPC